MPQDQATELGIVSDAARWLADRWEQLEGRYGRRGALAMALAALATFPIPGNVAAVVAAAEAIRGISGYSSDQNLSSNPMAHFSKTVLRLGTFQPKEGEFEATPQRMKHWEQTFKKMQAAGLAVPICWGHQPNGEPALRRDEFSGSDEELAQHEYEKSQYNAGYISDIRYDPSTGQLEMEGDVPGAELDENGNLVTKVEMPDGTKMLTAIKEVSASFRDWQDGQGRTWPDAMVHVALTPWPVVDGQQEGFEPPAGRKQGPKSLSMNRGFCLSLRPVSLSQPSTSLASGNAQDRSGQRIMQGDVISHGSGSNRKVGIVKNTHDDGAVHFENDQGKGYLVQGKDVGVIQRSGYRPPSGGSMMASDGELSLDDFLLSLDLNPDSPTHEKRRALDEAARRGTISMDYWKRMHEQIGSGGGDQPKKRDNPDSWGKPKEFNMADEEAYYDPELASRAREASKAAHAAASPDYAAGESSTSPKYRERHKALHDAAAEAHRKAYASAASEDIRSAMDHHARQYQSHERAAEAGPARVASVIGTGTASLSDPIANEFQDHLGSKTYSWCVYDTNGKVGIVQASTEDEAKSEAEAQFGEHLNAGYRVIPENPEEVNMGFEDSPYAGQGRGAKSSWDGNVHVRTEKNSTGGHHVINDSNGADEAGKPFASRQEAEKWAKEQGHIVHPPRQTSLAMAVGDLADKALDASRIAKKTGKHEDHSAAAEANEDAAAQLRQAGDHATADWHERVAGQHWRSAGETYDRQDASLARRPGAGSRYVQEGPKLAAADDGHEEATYKVQNSPMIEQEIKKRGLKSVSVGGHGVTVRGPWDTLEDFGDRLKEIGKLPGGVKQSSLANNDGEPAMRTEGTMTFNVGDQVQTKSGRKATIKEVGEDGSITVRWSDGSTSQITAEQQGSLQHLPSEASLAAREMAAGQAAPQPSGQPPGAGSPGMRLAKRPLTQEEFVQRERGRKLSPEGEKVREQTMRNAAENLIKRDAASGADPAKSRAYHERGLNLADPEPDSVMRDYNRDMRSAKETREAEREISEGRQAEQSRRRYQDKNNKVSSLADDGGEPDAEAPIEPQQFMVMGDGEPLHDPFQTEEEAQRWLQEEYMQAADGPQKVEVVPVGGGSERPGGAASSLGMLKGRVKEGDSLVLTNGERVTAIGSDFGEAGGYGYKVRHDESGDEYTVDTRDVAKHIPSKDRRGRSSSLAFDDETSMVPAFGGQATSSENMVGTEPPTMPTPEEVARQQVTTDQDISEALRDLAKLGVVLPEDTTKETFWDRFAAAIKTAVHHIEKADAQEGQLPEPMNQQGEAGEEPRPILMALDTALDTLKKLNLEPAFTPPTNKDVRIPDPYLNGGRHMPVATQTQTPARQRQPALLSLSTASSPTERMLLRNEEERQKREMLKKIGSLEKRGLPPVEAARLKKMLGGFQLSLSREGVPIRHQLGVELSIWDKALAKSKFQDEYLSDNAEEQQRPGGSEEDMKKFAQEQAAKISKAK